MPGDWIHRPQPPCYERGVARDDEIDAIVEVGRRTRKPTPRWLWIAAVLVGGICAIGFAVAMLAERAPAGHPPGELAGHRAGEPIAGPITGRPTGRSGLGAGLVIGAGAALVIGFSIARHRRSHSSRNSP